jgi:group I intron endonuclease
MHKSGIYQILSKKDGRSYIGSAVNLDKRWQGHIKNSKKPSNKQVISSAICLHGIDNFEFVVLEFCDVDQLIDREQWWLDKVRPFADEGRSYNIRKTANSNIGIKRSDASRKKQSAATKGVPKTKEHKQKLSESWHTNRGDSYYAQLSERMKGDKNPSKRPEVTAKISESRKGQTWKHDADRVAKHIESRKGKTLSDAAKLNMKLAQQKNKTRSVEAKEAFYIAQRVLYEITDPQGNKFMFYSRELKIFYKENSLSYANLITTAKTNKPYKKEWLAKRL